MAGADFGERKKTPSAERLTCGPDALHRFSYINDPCTVDQSLPRTTNIICPTTHPYPSTLARSLSLERCHHTKLHIPHENKTFCLSTPDSRSTSLIYSRLTLYFIIATPQSCSFLENASSPALPAAIGSATDLNGCPARPPTQRVR